MAAKKRALGRGLSALLENSDTDITSNYTPESSGDNGRVVGSVALIRLDQIEVNPFQPRNHFQEGALAELAASISEHGIIQPVTVRKLGYDKYQLISGERRFKASKIAGLEAVPAYIRVANDQSMLEMALVENLQRENLDAIEVAISFKRLLEECDLTQEALSDKVSKKRSTVTNYLRLLKLPAEIQLGIREKMITMGHARALINISDEKQQLEIYRKLLKENLSVRKVEELARGSQSEASSKKAADKSTASLSFLQQKIQEDLSDALETKVKLKRGNNGKGKIEIPFKSDDDLQRLTDLLST